MRTIIYYNPDCGTSRNALALIRAAGIEPTIIDYLASPPAKAELRALIAEAGLTVRAAIRQKEPAYLEHHLDDPTLSDDALLDRMIAVPILINRPFVQTPLGTRLCRPSDRVLEILPEKPLA